jgi:hypothetical protein
MAGKTNSTVGRAAALAAADRVRLLLNVVENDDFLTEVLHSADRTMVGLQQQGLPGADRLPEAQRDRAPLVRGTWHGRGRPTGRG